jgi:Peptidase family M28
MKRFLATVTLLSLCLYTSAQQAAPASNPPASHPPASNPPASDTALIARATPPDAALRPLLYLASDSLRGRHIGLPQIDTAAFYIANEFRKAGARPVPGATGYFQVFVRKFVKEELEDVDPVTIDDMPMSAYTTGLQLRNVVAYIPGTDPVLRQQYIVLSSHYDHIGVKDSARKEEGKMDSIYNGARDNATGTAGVIDAARYFARHPPRRSVLFICYTAEEEGLIGSDYYANHPLIPLKQTVFNLNIDNASYNTTHAICLFGLHRTSAYVPVRAACLQYGLAVLDEPIRGLFSSSDNYSLAIKGIPAPTFSLGMTSFDRGTIKNRYHRLSDEVGNMDLEYVLRFIRAYILSAKYIADDPAQPVWAKGDAEEEDWQALFKAGN